MKLCFPRHLASWAGTMLLGGCILMACSVLLSETTAALAAPSGDAPQGFGRHTVGGCEAESCLCVVTTLVDERIPGSLRSCAETSESKTVIFKTRGTIVLHRPLRIGSNKTIDGRKGS